MLSGLLTIPAWSSGRSSEITSHHCLGGIKTMNIAGRRVQVRVERSKDHDLEYSHIFRWTKEGKSSLGNWK